MSDLTLTLSVLVVGAAGSGVWIYNRLVRDKNLVANGWSDIDVQLVRRHDLVPQLVAAVRGYADYEQATLTAVAQLRQRSKAAGSLRDKAAIEDAIEAGVQRLIAVAEAYPDLKADQNFRQLARELTTIEDHLQYARRFYNGAVRQFNTRVASFPHLLVARLLRFEAAEFFEADDAARQAPPVSLNAPS